MIKSILATMLGLVVVAVFFLAMVNPVVLLALLVVMISYGVGKWMIG